MNKATATMLLIVDMINPLNFPGATPLRREAATPVAQRIVRLKQRMKDRGAPTIYVNDNFSPWLHDFGELVAICGQPDAPGAEMVQILCPNATTIWC